MRATLTVLFLAGSIVACSASENANHNTRCDSNLRCPEQMVCYREFCIPEQGLPSVDLDAAVISVEPAQDDARVRQPAEHPASHDAAAVEVVDGSVADSDATTSVGSTEDAQSGPVVPPTQVPPTQEPPTQMPDPPVSDPTGPTTPVPAVDAGAVVVDAGQVNVAANRALLIVCLPSCGGNRGAACFACLSGVLSRNPEVCAEAEGVDPLVSGMCDFLCTTAACRGRR
jgi:hypothetical protein